MNSQSKQCDGVSWINAHTACCVGALLTMLQASLGMAAAATNKGPPDFNGVWQIAAPITQLRTADGKLPPLMPAAQKVYDQHLAQRKAGDSAYDTTLQCKPMGEPRTSYDGGPFEILQRADMLVFGYRWNRTVRFVYIQDKPAEIYGPTYYGTSTAKWDGNILVVSATGFNANTLLDASGLPHSDALELTERFQLKDANTLEERLTFKDSKTFAKSWDAVLTYQKQPGVRIEEDVCLERRNITLKAPQ